MEKGAQGHPHNDPQMWAFYSHFREKQEIKVVHSGPTLPQHRPTCAEERGMVWWLVTI